MASAPPRAAAAAGHREQLGRGRGPTERRHPLVAQGGRRGGMCIFFCVFSSREEKEPITLVLLTYTHIAFIYFFRVDGWWGVLVILISQDY